MGTKTRKAERPFGWKDKFGYLMGDFGCNMSFTLISSYMFIFFTQYIGINLLHYATIILLTKIWDGVNDPIVGALVDRFTPKEGDKFRPWIFWGAIPLSLSAIVMFMDTTSWPYAGRLILCIVGYLVWDIAYTVVNVPYGSLNSTITADPVQRSQLSTFRSFGAVVAGLPLGIVIPMVAYKTISGQSIFQGQNMFGLALVLGIVAFLSFMALYFGVRERISHKGTEEVKFNYFKTLKGFFSNRAILAVSMAALSQTIFILSASSLGQMTYQMYFGNGKLSSLSIFAYLIPMFVVAPLVKPLVKKYGNKEICAWPMLGTVIVYLAMLILPIKSPYLWVGLQVIAALFSGGSLMVGWALVSDCIDYQELKTGRREEGSIYATYSMIRKMGQGIGQAAIPAIIALAIPGLVLNNSSTWNVEYAIQVKNLTALFPLIGYSIMFICYTFIYNLDKKTVTEMGIKLGRNVDDNTTSKEIA